MAAEWFIYVNGQQHGPYTAQQLMQGAARGKISPATKIRKGSNGQWVDAGQVAGLFQQGTATQAATPPPVSPPAVDKLLPPATTHQTTPPPPPPAYAPAQQDQRGKRTSSGYVRSAIFVIAGALLLGWAGYEYDHHQTTNREWEALQTSKRLNERRLTQAQQRFTLTRDDTEVNRLIDEQLKLASQITENEKISTQAPAISFLIALTGLALGIIGIVICKRPLVVLLAIFGVGIIGVAVLVAAAAMFMAGG